MSELWPRIIYQPIRDTRTGLPMAHEALARFPDESPHEVLKRMALTTRDQGAHFEINLMEQAINDFKPLTNEGARLHVNLSPRAIANGLRRVSSLIEQAPFPMIVEITEHDAIHDMLGLKQDLAHLRGKGAMIALDDMGSGFSDLSVWAALSPDIVKLDKCFIRGVIEERAWHGVIEAIISMSRDSRLAATVIAEGIETLEHKIVAEGHHIPMIQGYLYDPPESFDPRIHLERAHQASATILNLVQGGRDG